jgi:ubiquinone/menaquinone biosynthesis C-methylase UbiE
VNEFSQVLIRRSGYEGEGFAQVYDHYRPSPPKALIDILLLLAGLERADRVADLGAGTGLSTRAWSSRASEVVGIEPNRAMVEWARRATTSPNVRYVEGFAAATGLAGESVDIVTCAQAFHWMEPGAVLAEVARILRPGGVFAAYDYDVPPIVRPEVDVAFAAYFEARRVARERLGVPAGAATWPKDGHLGRLRESGHFWFTREFVCHSLVHTDADRIVGLAERVGPPPGALGGAAPEVDETFDALQSTARRVLGDRVHPMVVCYRARVGVK